jgi:ribosomal protein RSM22 (predicted rRNA methylase)
MRFAAGRMAAKHPGMEVSLGLADSPALLLISHVLTELSQDQATQLADLAAQAQAVLWVEPGTYETSLALIAARERLRTRMNVVAPCPHQGPCGILARGNERHWCHHFAKAPGGVFTDAQWARFGKLMGIDLRSLPLSYLVLDKRTTPLPPGATRVIGRPRLYKPYAQVLGCDASGVREHRLEKRAFPDLYRQARKDCLDSLQRWPASA